MTTTATTATTTTTTTTTTDEITICQILNKHDNVHLTLYTEWQDSGLKVTILLPESSNCPLTGKMKLAEIDIFAKNLSKTREEYMKQTRLILSGKDSKVEYILKDLKFRWKKGAWNHGMIELFESKLDSVFPDLLKNLIDRNLNFEKTVDELRIENRELRESENCLRKKIEDVINLKNGIEEDLYKRFLVVLNLKKDRIRELEREINRIKKNAGTDENSELKNRTKIYEADTEDEGENEDETGEEISIIEDNKKHKNKTEEAGSSRISLESFLNRNSSDSSIRKLVEGEKKKNEEGEIKLLKRQISSTDSEGKMIDSDYEEDRHQKTRRRKSKTTKKQKPVIPSSPKSKSNSNHSKSESKSFIDLSKNDEKEEKEEKEEEGIYEIENKTDESKSFSVIHNNTNKKNKISNFQSEESEEDIFA